MNDMRGLNRSDSLSLEALQEATGRTREDWMTILEQETVKSWSHEEIVDYLNKEYDVEVKWSELIACDYESKLQRKVVGQTASVGFQVGVRRTYPISQEQAWTLLTSPDGLKLWLGELSSFDLKVGQKYISKEGLFGELRVVKLYQQLRMTWQMADWESARINTTNSSSIQSS
ncbi:hypothetical protein D3C73_762980 [compost metagenome]